MEQKTQNVKEIETNEGENSCESCTNRKYIKKIEINRTFLKISLENKKVNQSISSKIRQISKKSVNALKRRKWGKEKGKAF